MDDARVSNHIEQLVAEEHRLLQAHSEGEGLGPEEHARVEEERRHIARELPLMR